MILVPLNKSSKNQSDYKDKMKPERKTDSLSALEHKICSVTQFSWMLPIWKIDGTASKNAFPPTYGNHSYCMGNKMWFYLLGIAQSS